MPKLLATPLQLQVSKVGLLIGDIPSIEKDKNEPTTWRLVMNLSRGRWLSVGASL